MTIDENSPQKSTLDDWLESWGAPLFLIVVGLAGIGLFAHDDRVIDRLLEVFSYAGALMYLTIGFANLPPVRRRWRARPMLVLVMVCWPLVPLTVVWFVQRG